MGNGREVRVREARGLKMEGKNEGDGGGWESTWLYTVTASLASKASTKGLEKTEEKIIIMKIRNHQKVKRN